MPDHGTPRDIRHTRICCKREDCSTPFGINFFRRRRLDPRLRLNRQTIQSNSGSDLPLRSIGQTKPTEPPWRARLELRENSRTRVEF
jgi:hypothetical protein